MPDVNITIKTINDSDKGTRSVIGSYTELWSAINLAGKALEKAKKVYEETIGAALKYADQVRSLSMLSGESTENTSRFIQVLDDYKISAEDALIATRALTKNGHAPSIETLAELSDQYLSLNSAEEQNAFLLKNLGKSGLQWVEILGKGSAAIKEQGEAVNASLILSQQAVDSARIYELALDDWNDSVLALKVSIGMELLPAMTDILNVTNDWKRAEELAAEQGKDLWMMGLGQAQSFIELAKAERHASDAAKLQTDTAAELTEGMEDLTVATNEVSKANQDLLSLMGNLQSETDSYRETAAELHVQQDQLRQDYVDGNVSAEEYKAQMGELTGAVTANAEAHEDAGKRIMFSLVQQEMAIGGLSSTERKQLEKMGVGWGIFSQQTVNEANAMMAKATELAGVTDEQLGAMSDSWKDPISKMTQANEKLHALQNMAGEMWTYYVNIETSGSFPNLPGTPGGSGGGGVANQQFATGGAFVIPSQYGFEGFNMGGMATASGGELVTITPKGAQQGSGAAIVINGNVNVYANNAEEFMLSLTAGEL